MKHANIRRKGKSWQVRKQIGGEYFNATFDTLKAAKLYRDSL